MGDTATFTVSVSSGTPTKFAWQYSDDNGKSWFSSTSANQTATYTTTATVGLNSRLFAAP